MKIQLGCLPCTLRQTLEASRMATDNVQLQKEIMDAAIDVLSRYESFSSPPEIGRAIHRIVKNKTGILDPYRQVKQKDLEVAFALYPKVEQLVESKKDRLYWALKAAAIGNTLDSAIYLDYDLEKSINEELEKSFAIYDISFLRQQLKEAKSLLLIGDNAGETVFDRLLLKQFPNLDITYAVRSAPIINDATIEDAKVSGIGHYAKIISSGCDAPGILLNECNEAFLNIFYDADIVINKGQGNYETLADSSCGRGVYFLLKVKCPVLSEMMDIDLNEYVFKYDTGGKNK